MTNLHVEVNLQLPDELLTLSSGDASALDPWLLDGASWRWTRGDVSTTGQPDPFEFECVIVSPRQLQLDIGSRISAQLWDAPPPLDDGEVVGFYGRVVEVTATPTQYVLSEGGSPVEAIEYDCKCVDYTVDLAEVEATYPAYDIDVTPSVASGRNRINAYVEAAAPQGAPQGVYGGLYSLDDWVDIKSEDPGAGGLLERIRGVMDQVGVGDLPENPDALDRRRARRAILSPRVDAASLPGDYALDGSLPASWAIDEPPAEFTSATATDFPLVLDLGPDGYELVPDDASPLVLPADHIDYAARWRRDKFSHPNRATVTYTPTGGSDESVVVVDADDVATGDPVVNLPLQAQQLGDEYGAGRMALMYLPEADSRNRWTAEAFRYWPQDWTRLQYAPWFPRHADIDPTPGTLPPDPASRASCYGHPLVVAGIDPAHNPTGRSWYAGTLHAVQLTCDGVDPVIEVTLRRSLPLPDGSGAMKVSDWPPGITPADLAPGVTVYDFRLARGA